MKLCKHSISFLPFMLMWILTASQNVGINTTSPLATLDVRGNTKSGGVTRSISYDSSTGRLQWNNSFLYVPTNQQLIQHSASAEGLFYNNSAIEYRNHLGAPVFYTNWNTGHAYFKGNLGVGIPSAAGKLHVQNGSAAVVPENSNLISETNTNNYLSFYTPDNFESAFLFQKPSQILSGGIFYNSPSAPDGFIFRNNNAPRMYIRNNGFMGIGGSPQSRLHVIQGYSGTGLYWPGLNLESDNTVYMNFITPQWAESGILFGTNTDLAAGGIVYNNVSTPNGMQFRTNGNSTKMVLTSQGRLGIGNSDPAYLMDINGRMRLRHWGTTAGIWFNNNSNTEAAFMGMEDDTHIGLYGNSGAGWKFSMNTTTGALKVNGSEGLPGQVITSNGNAASSWTSPTNYFYNNTVIKIQNAPLSLPYTTVPTPIPNMSHTFTVTGNAKVLVSLSLNLEPLPASNPGYTAITLELQLNGNYVTRFHETLGNPYEGMIFKAAYLVPVTAGTHTIRLIVSLTDDVRFYSDNTTFPSNMTFKIIPE